MKNLTVLAALFAVGCVDIKEDTATETTDTADTEEVVVADPSFAVSWGDSSVSLSITDAADGASYYWGIAENGATGGWTAEDCFMGYELEDGTNLTYCHPASATGVELAFGAGPFDVVEGSTTLFPDNSFSTAVTYIVDDRSSADAPCWTWGFDTTYYGGYEKSCTAM